MSGLIPLFQRLAEAHGGGDEDEGVQYAAIIKALRGAKISDLEVLHNLREVVLAHIAAGTAVYMEQGGPEIAASSLQLQPGRELLGLFNAILEAQERILRLERTKQWKREPSMSGSTSPESGKSLEPSNSIPTSSTKPEKSSSKTPSSM